MNLLHSSTLEIPTLETERLRLRAHRPEDFSHCVALWADPVVTRYIGGKPLTREEVWAHMLRYAGHWKWLGYGYWLLEEKASGKFVGEVGFADQQREIEPALDAMPEIGWVLSPGSHGKGYATEAVRAAQAWGDRKFGASKTVCLIHPDNLASIRVAEKCGYQEFCRTGYKGKPTILYSRMAPAAL